jgi:hypothetical protein
MTSAKRSLASASWNVLDSLMELRVQTAPDVETESWQQVACVGLRVGGIR